MKFKTTPFKMPFLGYEHGGDFLPFDFLIDPYGMPVVGIRIENLCQPFGEDPSRYELQHETFAQILGILGEGFTLQKLDVFSTGKWDKEEKGQDSEQELARELGQEIEKDSFLKTSYRKHFKGRKRQRIETFLFLSFALAKGQKKKASFKNKEQSKLLAEKAQKVFLSLLSSGLMPKYFREEDFESTILSVLSLSFAKPSSWQNLKVTPEHIQLGNDFAKVISLVDLEKMELPSEVSPSRPLHSSSTQSSFSSTSSSFSAAKDRFSFLHELKEPSVMIYHQVLSIPSQGERTRQLEKKKRRHEGVVSSSASNGLIAEELEEFLESISREGTLIVDAHFSLLLKCDSLESLERTESLIGSKLFSLGIVPSGNAFNQMELFRAILPGNSSELKNYDFFMTGLEAALCFFFSENKPKDEESDFYLHFTDREGIPLRRDPSDLPMQSGRISNRNKFVLGPSGSGKSFLMNNIVEQYLDFNYDVVIVDTGDSYKGICQYFKGRYIQYTEENPITMNPFLVEKEQLNLEKEEFLSRLVFLLWQGGDASISSTQKSVLDALIRVYYQHYFSEDTDWYKHASTEKLGKYLMDLGWDLERLGKEQFHRAKRKSQAQKTYYTVLGVASNASAGDIRKSARTLIKKYHPDRLLSTASLNDPRSSYGSEKRAEQESHFLSEVIEAYETLGSIEKRKVYDHSLSALMAPEKELDSSEETSEETSLEIFSLEPLREVMQREIQKLQRSLRVKELSFNSFYEFSEKFLPVFLKKGKYGISDKEFNLSTFLLVLKEFYGGGRYEKVLNQAGDASLFEEKFIVFEIDTIKDNPRLFPIVTLIIMDTFLQKMRHRKLERKALIIEEAWKAIASELMAGYILYLYKTVRKFYGEAIVVTQELDDVLSSPIVKEAILNNSDTLVLLDQSKFKDNFDRISSLLSLSALEQSKIFTINKLENKEGRGKFKEFYLKRGSEGEVYGNEVSIEQYLTYTTEKPEKLAVEVYLEYYGDFKKALSHLVRDLKKSGKDLSSVVKEINRSGRPLFTSLKSGPDSNPIN